MSDLETAKLMVEWMREQMEINETLQIRIQLLEAQSDELTERVYELEQK